MTTVSQSEVDEALREVDSLIDRIGDQTTGTINDQTDRGSPIVGREVQHGGHGYQIIGSTEIEHVLLQSGFNAVEALAAEEAVAAADGCQVQIDGTMIQSARRKLEDRADPDEIGQLREGLVHRLGRSDTVTEIQTNDQLVTAFTVSRKLFVYDREIPISQFNSEVQSLINAEWRGKAYLLGQYELVDGLNDDNDGPRGFQ